MLSSAAAAVALLRAITRVHHPDGLARHLRLHSSSVLGANMTGGTFAPAAARRIAPSAAAVLLVGAIPPTLHPLPPSPRPSAFCVFATRARVVALQPSKSYDAITPTPPRQPLH